jgi:hypothetical protein
MPSIKGLTPNQVALLDEMWACDSYEEFTTFMECLDAEDRAEAERLQRLLLIEMLDEDLEQQKEYPDARRVLLDIMSK